MQLLREKMSLCVQKSQIFAVLSEMTHVEEREREEEEEDEEEEEEEEEEQGPAGQRCVHEHKKHMKHI